MGVLKRGLAYLAVIGLVVIAVAGCGSSNASSSGSSNAKAGSSTSGKGGDILIAEVAPFTGAVAFYGQELDAAARLAVRDYGGSLASRIKFAKFDDACDPAKGVTAMRDALADSPAAILGPPCTAVVQATQHSANLAKVPHLVQALAPPLTQDGDQYIFRTIPNQNMDYRVLAKYAHDTMKISTVAILHGNDAYSESEGTTFKAAWQGVGGKVLGEETFTTGGQDDSASLLRLRNDNAQAIFLGGYEGDVGLATKTARQLGFKQPILGGTPMANQQYRSAAGASADGATYVSSVDPGNPAQAAFFKEWQPLGDGPVTDVSASVYLGMTGLLDALKTSNGSARNAQLRSALLQVHLPTKTGVAQWTPQGELAQPTIIIGRVKDGKATMLQRTQG